MVSAPSAIVESHKSCDDYYNQRKFLTIVKYAYTLKIYSNHDTDHSYQEKVILS